MQKNVLALGLDPAYAELRAFPGITADQIKAFIHVQLDRLRQLGYGVEQCLVDLGETAETVVAQHLDSRPFDCAMIGAGLRVLECLLLFERLLNLVHARAPQARICFNSTAADTAEAVRRWI